MRLSSPEHHNLYLSLVTLPVEITLGHATLIANSALLLSFKILEAFRDPPLDCWQSVFLSISA